MNWQEKIYESLTEARLSARERRARGGGGDPDPIVQKSGDPEAHSRRWSPIGKGHKPVKPLKPGMRMRHGETQAQTHARYEAEAKK
jgi:hypothetical protein